MMKAIIQAGGQGTRLRPITYETPKPLLTVHKKPIVSRIIEVLKRHDVGEIGVVVSAAHLDDFKKWLAEAPANIAEGVSLFVESYPSGTFGLLKNLQGWLDKEPFILANGDTLIDFNLESVKEIHARHKPVATIALVRVENPGNSGKVTVDENNLIVSFVEKPKDANEPSLVSAGLYILEPSIFDYDEPSKDFSMIEHDIFPVLAKFKKIAGATVAGRFYDCGTFEGWERAIREC